ncbi:MAG: hypothetical protein QG568_468 [Patescibacteria group bacterium]|nr:hypothetical protein [Patescibacteria group bacterium]
MNKNTKNTVIAVIAVALIATGIWMATKSKDSSDTLNIDASASSTVVSIGTSTSSTDTSSQINDGQTRDANGCITSANFVWDKKIGSCVHASKVSTSTTSITNSNTTKISDAMAQNLCNSRGGQWSEKVRECLGVSKNVCESIGGQFNECASACRNNPEAQVCTLQCVQVCSIK